MSLVVDRDEVSPEDFAGNLNRMEHYAYFGDLSREELEDYGIWYLHSRDSDHLQESNWAFIHKAMEPWLGSDVFIQRDSHWAVGWIEGLLIRVYKPGTQELTDAFNTMSDIRQRLDEYPVLDESDWSEREFNATMDNIRDEASRYLNGAEPPDWDSQVDEALHDSGMTMCSDGSMWPDYDPLIEFLGEQGWLDEEYWPAGYVPPEQRPNWEREPKDAPGQGRMF